eukprot:TRINITY_DN83980_c0_g1_i1.p1 TRINITY_DN83980_c0_g1~~TRINITY_DN83980_c0_g1_i1.p1  ORF type:complete len:435 (+),score=63.27 TRINITY_DN83980_c0_g1_i1:39-1307(+)
MVTTSGRVEATTATLEAIRQQKRLAAEQDRYADAAKLRAEEIRLESELRRLQIAVATADAATTPDRAELWETVKLAQTAIEQGAAREKALSSQVAGLQLQLRQACERDSDSRTKVVALTTRVDVLEADKERLEKRFNELAEWVHSQVAQAQTAAAGASSRFNTLESQLQKLTTPIPMEPTSAVASNDKTTAVVSPLSIEWQWLPITEKGWSHRQLKAQWQSGNALAAVWLALFLSRGDVGDEGLSRKDQIDVAHRLLRQVAHVHPVAKLISCLWADGDHTTTAELEAYPGRGPEAGLRCYVLHYSHSGVSASTLGIPCKPFTDHTKAMQYLREGHASGSLPCTARFAFCLWRGLCVKANWDDAKSLLTFAASAGLAVAQNNLACLLSKAEGLDSEADALKWFSKAARQGNAAARQNLESGGK